MIASISLLVLAVSVRVSSALAAVTDSLVTAAPSGINPRCDWVNALEADGTNPVQVAIENLYGFVLEYMPLIVIALLIALGLTAGFAIRKKVLGALIPAFIALFLLGAVVGAVFNIGGSSVCT